MSDAIFISHASADRLAARSIVDDVEQRGFRCWIAGRDVKAGENYQEAIVAAIRNSRALLLVFSNAANRSDEIKKELSLASRYHVPVITLRTADVEPSDAFAYELSTRQWIDAFPSRAHALDMVAARIGELEPRGASPAAPPAPPPRPARSRLVWPLATALVVALLAAIGGAVWFKAGPSVSAAKSMQVRLTGFKPLSSDIPSGMSDAMLGELTAALDEEGVVKVSSAPAPPPGDAPAFSLGGTIRRDGDQVRVIVRLLNERSGADLWSDTFSYGPADVSRIPRLVAVDAGLALRCGLFGASTNPRTMPDAVMNDYMARCSAADDVTALAASRRVVAASPDFSWGWSGVAVSATQASWAASGAEREALRREARAAADRAVALDPTNSEALAWKSFAIDPADLAARDALLTRAVAARPLSCGCEHNLRGQFLDEMGRSAEAIGEYRRAVGAIALDYYSQGNLGFALMAAGREREGKAHVDASVELADEPGWRMQMALLLAPVTRNYAPAISALDDPASPSQPARRAAWRVAVQSLSANMPDRTRATTALAGLDASGPAARVTIGLLGALGANTDALDLAERRARAGDNRARASFFLPSLAPARASSAFAGVAGRLGLMRYWRATKTRPDECHATPSPAYCGAI